MKSLLLTTALITAPMVGTVSAQSTTTLKRQIAEQSRQIAELEKEVSSLRSQLNLERKRNGKPALPTHKVSTTPAPSGAYKTYIVKSGDSFSKIARQNGISLAALIKANKGVKPDKISIGQKINIPAHPGKVITKPTVTKKPVAAKGTYIVVKGDSLWGIAKRHGLTLKQLLAVNPKLNPKKLKIGQVVNVTKPSITTTRTKSPTKPKTPTKPKSPVTKTPVKKTPVKKTPQPVAKTPLPEPVIEKHIDQNPQVARRVKVSREMTYGQFAAQNGTTVSVLNTLNGLDLPADEPLAVGSELFVPNNL